MGRNAFVLAAIILLAIGCDDGGGGGVTPATFTYTVIDQSAMSGGDGRGVFVEHDSLGRIQAGYAIQLTESPSSYEVNHVVIDGTDVTVETVDTTSSYNIAFTVGPNDYGHMVFYNGDYYYGTNTTGTWVANSLAGLDAKAMIAVNDSGVPYVPGHNAVTTDDNRVIFSNTGGASWNDETISPMDGTALLSFLTRDYTGRPLAISRVSTMDTTDIGIYERGVAAWLGVDMETFGYTEIRDAVIDTTGNIYMLLYSNGGIVLRKFDRSTTFWTTIWADYANSGAVALNSAGEPYVLYVDSAGDLNLAYEGSTAWTAVPVEIFANIYSSSSNRAYDLTITSDGTAHMLYYDNLRAQLFYAKGKP